jgi:hypothetical protein
MADRLLHIAVRTEEVIAKSSAHNANMHRIGQRKLHIERATCRSLLIAQTPTDGYSYQRSHLWLHDGFIVEAEAVINGRCFSILG